jgi:hypothetical protein
MPGERPDSIICTFCGQRLSAPDNRSRFDVISFLARHVAACECLPTSASSLELSEAIEEMARTILSDAGDPGTGAS